MSCPILQVTQGNRFTQPVTFTLTGMDWTGVRVRCQLKVSLDAIEIVTTFDSEGGDAGTTITLSQPSPGVLLAVLDAEEMVTRAWPLEGLVADILLSRDSPLFGPYTVPSFTINVRQPVTT